MVANGWWSWTPKTPTDREQRIGPKRSVDPAEQQSGGIRENDLCTQQRRPHRAMDALGECWALADTATVTWLPRALESALHSAGASGSAWPAPAAAAACLAQPQLRCERDDTAHDWLAEAMAWSPERMVRPARRRCASGTTDVLTLSLSLMTAQHTSSFEPPGAALAAALPALVAHAPPEAPRAATGAKRSRVAQCQARQYNTRLEFGVVLTEPFCKSPNAALRMRHTARGTACTYAAARRRRAGSEAFASDAATPRVHAQADACCALLPAETTPRYSVRYRVCAEHLHCDTVLVRGVPSRFCQARALALRAPLCCCALLSARALAG
jgi:hypothetical protein